MNVFEQAGYGTEEAEKMQEICVYRGIPEESVISALSGFQQVFSSAAVAFKNAYKVLAELYGRFNFSDREFRHNYHMSTYHKKKRVRKKYAKKLFK